MNYRLTMYGAEFNETLAIGLVKRGKIIDGDVVNSVTRDSFSGVFNIDVISEHKYVVSMNDSVLSNEFKTRGDAEYFVINTLPGTSTEDLQKDHFYWPSVKARGKIKVKISRVKE